MKQFLEGTYYTFINTGVCGFWHLGQTDEHQQEYAGGSQSEIWANKYAQIVFLQYIKLCVGQGGTLFCGHRTHLALYEFHGDIHTHQSTYGVECLCQVQSLGGSILATHAVNIGVARRFQE